VSLPFPSWWICHGWANRVHVCWFFLSLCGVCDSGTSLGKRKQNDAVQITAAQPAHVSNGKCIVIQSHHFNASMLQDSEVELCINGVCRYVCMCMCLCLCVSPASFVYGQCHLPSGFARRQCCEKHVNRSSGCCCCQSVAYSCATQRIAVADLRHIDSHFIDTHKLPLLLTPAQIFEARHCRNWHQSSERARCHCFRWKQVKVVACGDW
jgi:hypothetical protein